MKKNLLKQCELEYNLIFFVYLRLNCINKIKKKKEIAPQKYNKNKKIGFKTVLFLLLWVNYLIIKFK
jgi:hypothetical protein